MNPANPSLPCRLIASEAKNFAQGLVHVTRVSHQVAAIDADRRGLTHRTEQFLAVSQRTFSSSLLCDFLFQFMRSRRDSQFQRVIRLHEGLFTLLNFLKHLIEVECQ